MPSDEKPNSIWKKELSFKRKPQEATPAVESADAAPTAEPASVWKKEISLRRKPKQTPTPVAPEPVLLEAVPAPVAPEPVLLEDLPAPAPAPVAPVAATVPAPVAPVAVEVDHSWLTQPLEDVSAPPVASVVELHPPAPVPPAVLEPPPPAPAPVAPALVTPALVAAPELPPPLPAPPISVPEGLAPEVWADPFVDVPLALPPELLEAAAALLEPEPLVEPAEEKASFLKRELKRKRGPKAEKPARAKAREAGPKVPLHKRQLSLRRSKTEPVEGAEPPAWEETDVAKPFYKREFSFKRASKAAPEETPTVVEAPGETKVPRVKRARPTLKLPTLSRPSLGRATRPRAVGAGGKGAKKLVGLKIGASQIAAAQIANGETPELIQLVREPLEAGIVVNGELRDPEALAIALREFFRKHGLPKRAVRLGIANNRIGVRTFDVNGIADPKQLANAIRFRAQEVLPIPIEEAVLDYQILSETVDEEGNVSRRVLLVVAYRELVDRYVHACAKAGIQIVGIDLEAFALLRALAEPRTPVPGSENAALVAVSVGHERSTFAVSDGRVCEFTRVLEWGGWALNVAIARALDLSPSEAEPIKRSLSFVGPDVLPAGVDEEKLATAREAARRQLQSFARELVSSLQFYQNQPGSLSIGEIVFTGGTTHLPGFGAELERLIGVPVRVGDPLARLKVTKKLGELEQIGSLAIAIGLGIED